MKTIKAGIAALATLALAASSAAFASTDGTLGPTSTGTFSAGYNVIPVPVPDVQVFGLTDFVQPMYPGDVTTYSQYFCITRSETGPVSLTISAFTYGPEAGQFELYNNNTPDGLPIALPVTVRVLTPFTELFTNIGNGSPTIFNSGPTCTDDDAGSAYDIGIGVNVPADHPTGLYQNIFTLLVAPQ